MHRIVFLLGNCFCIWILIVKKHTERQTEIVDLIAKAYPEGSETPGGSNPSVLLSFL